MTQFNKLLNAKMPDNDAFALTIQDYLQLLLLELWAEKDAFSGQYPFGNSGWEYDIYQALVANGFVSGELDEYGEVVRVDKEACDKLIETAIKEVFEK